MQRQRFLKRPELLTRRRSAAAIPFQCGGDLALKSYMALAARDGPFRRWKSQHPGDK
ncbi:hypothetical protein GGE07_000916 [Sinorhizobium terangae]|uniref:Uncharacterized protein n=1 Tax=Sinorhizobium terangae TaxID=110322 RepID=A0A6N7L828_SINTE|nr:hypothetical protein [Sinorhizobium terangae]MBB4184290.1 hypothetical protein [Sinorhizobium terangae]MQX13993.1 hypothetical protein [Sinorhizobium terangae]